MKWWEKHVLWLQTLIAHDILPILELHECWAGSDPGVIQLQPTSRRPHLSRALPSNSPTHCSTHGTRYSGRSIFLREDARRIHCLYDLFKVSSVAQESCAGAGEDNDTLQERGVDGGDGKLPPLLESREMREKLTDARRLFERGEIFEHLVDIQ